jgi:protein-tyrosine-phosphatase
VGLDDIDRARLVIGLAPEHVEWVRREHSHAAPHTATLKRLVRDLADDGRPLAQRIGDLHLDEVELGEWEEVVDPGGGEAEVFVACAHEVVALVDALVARLAY